MVYTGRIKEKAILDKNYKECKWIGKRNLEDYNFLPLDKEILTDFFAEQFLDKRAKCMEEVHFALYF